jgi:hypothetical protein
MFEQNFERRELPDLVHSEDRRARSDRARPSARVRRAIESSTRPERFLPGGLGDGFAGCFSPRRSGPFEISKLSDARRLQRDRLEAHRESEPDGFRRERIDRNVYAHDVEREQQSANDARLRRRHDQDHVLLSRGGRCAGPGEPDHGRVGLFSPFRDDSSIRADRMPDQREQRHSHRDGPRGLQRYRARGTPLRRLGLRQQDDLGRDYPSDADADGDADGDAHEHALADADDHADLDGHRDADGHALGDADEHAYSDADDHANLDEYRDADGYAHGNPDEHVHPDADDHADLDEYRDADGHRDADGYAHGDSDEHVHPDADGHTDIDGHEHVHPDTDGNSGRDKHADRHPDRHPNRHADEYVDEHSHGYSGEHVYEHTDRDVDAHFNVNCDADGHTDAHGDAHRNAHPDADSNVDEHPDADLHE